MQILSIRESTDSLKFKKSFDGFLSSENLEMFGRAHQPNIVMSFHTLDPGYKRFLALPANWRDRNACPEESAEDAMRTHSFNASQ